MGLRTATWLFLYKMPLNRNEIGTSTILYVKHGSVVNISVTGLIKLFSNLIIYKTTCLLYKKTTFHGI